MRLAPTAASGAASAWLLLELAVEEVGGGLVAFYPVAVTQEVVHFVGEHELLDVDTMFAQRDD